MREIQRVTKRVRENERVRESQRKAERETERQRDTQTERDIDNKIVLFHSYHLSFWDAIYLLFHYLHFYYKVKCFACKFQLIEPN